MGLIGGNKTQKPNQTKHVLGVAVMAANLAFAFWLLSTPLHRLLTL
jgi:hypothetical protein